VLCGHFLPAVPPKKITRGRPAAAKLRSWRVIIIRGEGEHLGTVEAPDRERAVAVSDLTWTKTNGADSPVIAALPQTRAHSIGG
jgi:hypothetical protein